MRFFRGDDPEEKEEKTKTPWGIAAPDPRSLGRDDPAPKPHEASFGCMYNHEHKTQAAADSCSG